MNSAQLAALDAAIYEQGICSGWDNASPDEAGHYVFTCECGRANATFVTHEAGETAMDAHLDAEEVRLETFIRAWVTEHAPGTHINLI